MRTSYCGEKVAGSKLTESRVREMRRLYAEGSVSYSELGRLFGLSSGYVSLVVQGRAWAHVA